jgi:hypothetical protein
MIFRIESASQTENCRVVFARFLEHDHTISTHHNQQLVASLQAESGTRLAWNYDLVLLGKSGLGHRFTFYHEVKRQFPEPRRN